jgi:hypothetical protein
VLGVIFANYYKQVAITPERSAAYVNEVEANTLILHYEVLHAESCELGVRLVMLCTTSPRKMTKQEREAATLRVAALHRQVEAEGGVASRSG